ncbi:MAG: rhamnulokinase [Acidimicrobiaceae bacterium]|nr:rhamnulokinase [Acidimicrobiaceae bacterium]
MSTTRVVAVDLGASSGRVFLGTVDGERLGLSELHRFANGGVTVGGTLYWDVLALYRGILEGLREGARVAGAPDSIGIDSWGVDFGLIDRTGALLGNPVHHRDRRTEGVVEAVLEKVPAAELYARTGIQLQRFNTLFQLVAATGSPQLEEASEVLLVPDLINYWLTGLAGTEETNASTTQLLSAAALEWDVDIAGPLGIDTGMFPPLRRPGDSAGELLPGVLEEIGLEARVPVTAVASHDTASAVAGVPAANGRFAYISCGTWSLVGLELASPVLGEASRKANFTNERGVDGTTRYLRNVMGLWLLQESIRAWERSGLRIEVDALVRDAAALPELAYVVDPDDPAYLAPGDIPARIAAACQAHGERVPETPAAVTRTILDSLALAYRRTIELAQLLTGRDVDTVHIVGGGAQNELLCQLTADACGLPVVAGPVEAAALGNVLVQARAVKAISGDLADMRATVRARDHFPVYRPQPGRAGAWRAAEARLTST